jgi:hypothetical protein
VAQIIQAMARFITLIVDGLVVGIKKASEVLAFFDGVIAEIIKTVAAVFGIQNRFDPGRKAKGSAVYQPTVSGVEEFANRQFAESLKGINQNRGQGKTPEQFLPEIANAIDKGRAKVEELITAVDRIFQWVQRRFGDAEELQQAAGEFVKGGLLGALRKGLIS